jgi:signal transduction histidine kinase
MDVNFPLAVERARRLERLLEIHRVLATTLELQPLLQAVVDAATELSDSEYSCLLLFDPEIQQLRLEVAPWLTPEAMKVVSIPLEHSIAGQVFRRRRPAVLQVRGQDSRPLQALGQLLGLPTRSVLAVPLVFRDKSIGVLKALNKGSGADYTGEDASLLESLSVQAATAIGNIRLLRDVQEAYKQLSSLDSVKSDFIAIASHEFRTPLGLILGHAAFLREGASPEVRDQLEVIVRNAERLKKIIEDLSSLTYLDPNASKLTPKTFSVQEALDDIRQRFAPTAQQRYINLRSECTPIGMLLEADREKILLALENLVDNALSFTGPGGHVLVGARGIPAGAGERSGWVEFEVVDDGIGIPADKLERIFDRFYQVESHLRRRRGGLGLGLSVAKSMVDRHGGRIWAESVVGKGSRFAFRMPDRQEAVGEEPRTPHS